MVPSLLRGSAFRSTAGYEVKELVAPNAAAVRRGGEGSMLLSSLPLRATDRSGEVRAVDLSLEEAGGLLVADNPLVDVAIAQSAARGVRLGGGVSLRPLVAQDAAGVVSDDKAVVFANTAEDQDFVVAPVPQGVETFWQIRSPQAPQTMRLAVGVPAGASLRHNQQAGEQDVGAGMDSVDVVKDGKVLASILPPSAFDAQGQRLDVEVTLEGDVVAYEVAHRSADIAYPAILDPAVVEHHNWNDGRGGARFSWYHRTKLFGEGTGDRWSFPWLDWWVHPGKGLHADTIAGRTLDHHEWGQWMWTAPPDTFIKTAQFGNVVYSPYDSMYTGIIGSSPYDPIYGTNWESLHHEWGYVNWEQRFHCATADCRGGTDQNSAALGVAIWGTGWRQYSNNAYAGWVTLEMGDRHPPAFTSIGQVSTQFPDGPALGAGWTRSSHATTRMISNDRGHGIRTIGLAPRDGDTNPTNDPFSFVFWGDECAGSSDDAPCSKDVDITRQYFLPEGDHEVRVAVEDVVGNRGYANWQARSDRSKPTAGLSGTLLGGRVGQGRDYSLKVDAGDAYSGARSIEVLVDGRRIADQGGFVDRGCGAGSGCSPTGFSKAFTVSTGGLAYGQHTLEVVVGDAVGHSHKESRTFSVRDIDAPALKVTGGLRSFPVETGRTLTARATDTDSGVRDTRVYLKPTDGLTPDSAAPDEAQRVHLAECTVDCTSATGFATTYRLPDNTKSGRYQLTVVTQDAQGNKAEDRWVLSVVQMRSGRRQKLGLEHWFDMDDTDAGGESGLFVNGETGNTVWHHVPVVNPGRGLSSTVNLTYNSHDRGGLVSADLGRVSLVGSNPDDDEVLGQDLTGLAYREAGVNVSLGIGGPTRVNEPLGGVLVAGALERAHASHDSPWGVGLQEPTVVPDGRISLTDADGTQHVFLRPEGSTQWQAPPGVDMRLRYIGARGVDAAQQLTISGLEQDAAWELLRPDGVRFLFDSFGYLQRTEDRNGNALDYVYRAVSAITGQDCGTQAPIGRALGAAQQNLGLCIPQLVEVRQPDWPQDNSRKISLTYTNEASETANLFKDLGLDPGLLIGAGYVTGNAPQIDTITDASKREYDLDYFTEGPLRGYLKELRENDNPTRAGETTRTTRLKYDEPKLEGDVMDVRMGDAQQLTEVVPVVGGQEQPSTRVTHQPRRAPDPVRPPAPRPAAKIAKRSGAPTLYRYQAAGEGQPARFGVYEHTSPQRYLERRSTLDVVGRPAEVLEQSVDLADDSSAPVAVAGQGQTITRLVWDDVENKPKTVTEAVGTPAERSTEYTYSASGSGALTKRVVRQGEGSLTWTFDFYDDREGGFIADLDAMTEPGGRTWDFVADLQGNVRARTTPNGVTMHTEYGPGGVVTAEQDEMGRWTRYGDFEATGQPQTVTQPGDEGLTRRWRYRYDARGDVTSVVDPRNQTDATAKGSPFVTTLEYDGFARPTGEHLPRNSGRVGADEGPAFVQRTRRFDRDGNVVSSTDARGLETTIDYDPMDQPIAVHQPGSNGAETTRYVYDDAQRLIAQTLPRGAAGSDPGALGATIRDQQVSACEGEGEGDQGSHPYTTRHCLDHRGQPLASAQYSQRAGDIARRITAFSYDGRGNRVGVNEPNRNTTTMNGTQVPLTIAQAVAKVADPAQRHVSTSYDLLDRLRSQVQRPAEAGRPVRERDMVYDLAGDLVRVTEVGPQGQDRVTTMDYDQMGRLLARTDPLGRTTCWARQADGLATAQTTPRGTATGCPDPSAGPTPHTTTFSYNAVGELASRSIPYATEQYAPDRAKQWKVSYTRDAVGNPTRITDARGNEITNTFYDSGELRSTTRPSFWELNWGEEEEDDDGQTNPQAGERYEGSDAADVEVATDGPQIVEREGRSANAEQSGRLPDKPASLGKGDLGEVKPQQLPSWLPQAGDTKLRYDPDMRLSEVVDIDDQARRIRYDDAGRVAGKSWPLDSARRIEHAFAYDQNGNLQRVSEDWRAGDQVVTRFGYDGYDRRISEDTEGANPDSYAADSVREVTAFAYDANDNLTTRTTPRGTAFSYTYDSLDQLTSEANPLNETWRYGYDPSFGERTTEIAPHAAGDASELYTTRQAYDAAGQLTRREQLVDQPGEQAPAQLVWSFGYDADGNRNREEAPGAPDRQITRIEHDGRGLAWRTTRSGAGIGDRVSITEYDQNGNVRRQVSPAGVGSDGLPVTGDDGSNTAANLEAASRDATVRSYDADDLQVQERLPWRDSGGRTDERWMREWSRDNQGWVTSIGLPREVEGSPVGRASYDHNAAGWITSSTDDAGITTRYSYNEQGQQERWRTEHANIDDRGRDLRFAYWPNGLLKQRSAVKTLDRAGSTDDETTKRTYQYLYNQNRSLVRVVDRDPSRGEAEPDRTRITVFARDDAERETRIDEEWREGNDVLLGYDAGATGWLKERRTDGTFDSAGAYAGQNAKVTRFAYDSQGRELSMTVDPAKGPNRTTTTRWHDGGQMHSRTKPNATMDTWSWNALGEKTRHVRDPRGPGAGGEPRTQDYTYDQNANRTQDERGTHAYNARDQLVRWTRSQDRGREDRRGWTTSYELNGSGAMLHKVERDKSGAVKLDTSFAYDGERLDEVVTVDRTQAVAVTTTQTHRYDDAGNVQRIYTRVKADGDVVIDEPEPERSALSPDECEAEDLTASTRTTRYCYDEFNRQVFASGGNLDPFYVSYDGLDRRDRKVRKDKATGAKLETRDYTYIGTSELLASESTVKAGADLPEQRRSYDYDSQGDRQGQQTDTATGETRYRPYAKDANGSVLGLENTEGEVPADERYDYDPYGELDRKPIAGDTTDDPDAGLSQEAKDNPFRFQGFYYDSGVKTYDMHARHYRPDTGRFLQTDQYAAAAGNQALQADPLTQNRYAFAGANPTTNVEFDGHVFGGFFRAIDRAARAGKSYKRPARGSVFRRSRGGPRRGARPAGRPARGDRTIVNLVTGLTGRPAPRPHVRGQRRPSLPSARQAAELAVGDLRNYETLNRAQLCSSGLNLAAGPCPSSGESLGAVLGIGVNFVTSKGKLAKTAVEFGARQTINRISRGPLGTGFRWAKGKLGERAAKASDDWPAVSGIVRDATKGKGNYGLGSGTASQARQAGESWVGEGYRIASDGKTLVSRDGLRTFRPPTWKPKQNKYQANFEYWNGERVGKPFGNGHLDITDMTP